MRAGGLESLEHKRNRMLLQEVSDVIAKSQVKPTLPAAAVEFRVLNNWILNE